MKKSGSAGYQPASICLSLLLLLQISTITSAQETEKAKENKIVCTPLRSTASEDLIRVLSTNKNFVRLEVTCKRGIGAVRLTFAKSYKPTVLEIRFNRFRYLENFTVQCGKRRISSNLKQSPISWESNTSEESQQATEKKSENKISIKGWRKDGLIVRLSCADILKNAHECTISWIDAYR